MRYRADIDGLRAVAVLPVVLGHAGLAWFRGGYVGVDVFFVISGFLITGILLEDLAHERFSLAGFYDRRIRRIFPALFVVLAATAVAAALILMPTEFLGFSRSLVAAALFGSNMLFWHEVDYFDASADMKPLLHTWSLSVEEQFYLFFPLILALLHAGGPRRRMRFLSLVLLLSFVGSVYLMGSSPRSPFYLAPLRAWELMLGALLAAGAVPPVQRAWARELAAAAGLGLILVAVFTYSEQTLFPGIAALLPCVGTALLLHAGGSGPSQVGRLLSVGPVVRIGQVSYSLYLWHWPILSLSRYYAIRPLGTAQLTIALLVALGLSVLTWRYIEQPFRGRRGFLTRRALFLAGGLGTLAFVAVGLAGWGSGGWPTRFPERVRELASYAGSFNPRRSECLELRQGYRDPGRTCVFGAPAAAATWALWGDSHADPLIAPLGERAGRQGLAVRYFGHAGCAPVIGIERWDKPHRCRDWNGAVLDYLLDDDRIRHVVLVARWSSLLHGRARELGPAERGDADPVLGDGRGPAASPADGVALFERRLQETIAALLSRGKRVYLVYPIPEVGYDVPSTLARLAARGADPAGFTISFAAYQRRQRDVVAMFARLGPRAGLVRVHPEERLCDSLACVVYADGQPLYRDDDHLSLAGAGRVLAVLDSDLAAAGARAGRPASSRGPVAGARSVR